MIDAHPVPGGVVDTTGAGDLYAAGFLYGFTHGHDLGTLRPARRRSRAAEVISHLGARPEVSLAELAATAARVAGARRAAQRSSPATAPATPRSTRRSRRSSTQVGARSTDADLVFELVVSAAPARPRPRRPRRPEDRQRRAEGDALLVPRLRAVPRRRARSRSSARPAPSPTTRSTTRPAGSPPAIAAHDWMVITGAGPGIMEAGIEGAGPEQRVRRQHPAAVRGDDERSSSPTTRSS